MKFTYDDIIDTFWSSEFINSQALQSCLRQLKDENFHTFWKRPGEFKRKISIHVSDLIDPTWRKHTYRSGHPDE